MWSKQVTCLFVPKLRPFCSVDFWSLVLIKSCFDARGRLWRLVWMLMSVSVCVWCRWFKSQKQQTAWHPFIPAGVCTCPLSLMFSLWSWGDGDAEREWGWAGGRGTFRRLRDSWFGQDAERVGGNNGTSPASFSLRVLKHKEGERRSVTVASPLSGPQQRGGSFKHVGVSLMSSPKHETHFMIYSIH